MLYRLATYRECKAHREWNTTCPSCGRRGKFSPYIDTVTMRPVDDRQCGRCNREKSCAYHMTPSEWFKEHPTEKREWLPKEQYIELMRQRRREAAEIRKQPTNSPSVYRGSTAEPGGSCLSLRPANYVSKRSAEQNDTTRFACNAPALTGTPSINRGGVSGDAERIHYSRMRRACEQSQPWGSHLVTWLRTQFPRDAVAAALKRYRVGGTPDGATLWWQIDTQGRVHTGKAMQYNPLTGHRVKESGPPLIPPRGEDRGASTPPPRGRVGGGSFPVNWAHRMRLYGEPSDLVVPQCLFGEHLVNVDVNVNDNCHPEDIHREAQSSLSSSLSLALQAATPPLVMLVESEKTALIMSLVCPGHVWLATGGKANFKEQMLAPLIGLEVAVYPDADALRDWYVRAVEMNRTLGTRLYIPTWYYNLMDHPEAIARGLDLADVVMGL